METQMQFDGMETPSTPPTPVTKPWYKRKSFVIGIVVIVGLVIMANVGKTKPEAAARAAVPDTSVSHSPATTEVDSAVSLDDFQLDLIVLESQCFDTAGGLVTIEPDLSIPGASYDGQATLVYEVHGGDSVETFRLELDGTNFTYNEETISTPTCSSHLTAVPVRLIER